MGEALARLITSHQVNPRAARAALRPLGVCGAGAVHGQGHSTERLHGKPGPETGHPVPFWAPEVPEKLAWASCCEPEPAANPSPAEAWGEARKIYPGMPHTWVALFQQRDPGPRFSSLHLPAMLHFCEPS